MERESQTESYGSIVKILAIIGFFGTLTLIAWLLVQSVRLVPTFFSSLAQIAETVNTYSPQNHLELTLEKDLVNAGEMVALNWNNMGEGSYTFTHTCSDDTTLSVRTHEEIQRELSCNDTLSLPQDALGLYLTPQTKSQRVRDVSFTVTFIPNNSTLSDTHTKTGVLTVINAAVPFSDERSKNDSDKRVSEITLPKPTPTKDTHLTTPTPNPIPHTQTNARIVALTPESFQNGFTDLKMSYQGIGVVDSTNNFVPKATLGKNDRGALQFYVKNIGTKTSEKWSYTLTLPGGLTYTSDMQPPLTPNERAAFTVQFDLKNVRTVSASLGGFVTTPSDSEKNNNSFSWSVKID